MHEDLLFSLSELAAEHDIIFVGAEDFVIECVVELSVDRVRQLVFEAFQTAVEVSLKPVGQLRHLRAQQHAMFLRELSDFQEEPEWRLIRRELDAVIELLMCENDRTAMLCRSHEVLDFEDRAFEFRHKKPPSERTRLSINLI